MRNLIHQILKENKEWYEDLKPLEVYMPWVDEAIKDFEIWVGDAYQHDDEIGEAIAQLKLNPTKENVLYTIKTIEKWQGHAYVKEDDFDWALGTLKMSISPESWKKFNVFK